MVAWSPFPLNTLGMVALLIVPLLIGVAPANAHDDDGHTHADMGVQVLAPREGVKIVMDRDTARSSFVLEPVEDFPIGSPRARSAVLFDGWHEGMDGPSFMVSTRSGLALAEGESGFDTICVTGCGPNLGSSTFRKDFGTDHMSHSAFPVIAALPDTILWGHTLHADTAWDLPLRKVGRSTYGGDVAVAAYDENEVVVDVRVTYIDTEGTELQAYSARLMFQRAGGGATIGPFADVREITRAGNVESVTVTVVEEGAGKRLPFSGGVEDDAYPLTDARFPNGPSSPRPHDPRPHHIFDVNGVIDTVLALPDADVQAWLASGDMVSVEFARFLRLGSTIAPGWPAHEVAFVGQWQLWLCNDSGVGLDVTMNGVKPHTAPFAPATVFTNTGPFCHISADDVDPHAALGDVLRAVDGVARDDLLWQHSAFVYEGSGRPRLYLTYDHPELAEDMDVEVRLDGPPVIVDGRVPRTS